jgi:lipid-A-disaccharide synthase
VLIIAGETSGDLHGANLVRAVHRVAPEVHFCGIGGDKLREAGVEILVHSSRLAVVGITEVLSKLGAVSRALGLIKSLLTEKDLDLAILIDFPDFNLHVATHLRRRGVRILYYISPQIWAWRGWRIRKIKRLVDKMVVILPFEASLYERKGVDATFVGHPLLDVVRPHSTRDEYLNTLGIDSDRQVVGFFPGSRDHEVGRLLPVMLGAARLLLRQIPNLHFLIALAPGIDDQCVSQLMGARDFPVTVSKGSPYDTMAVSEMLVVASGTATLEAAILGVPMVIVYKVSTLTSYIGRMMARVKHIGLVNLVANKTVVPELIQDDVTSERVAEEALSILMDKGRLASMKSALLAVKKNLGRPGASDRVADTVLEMMDRA